MVKAASAGFQLEESTLRALRERDPALLEKLFTELNPYLLRMLGARRVFGAEAEEFVCQVWHTFFESIEAFQGRSEIRTFLGGILINKLREARRAETRMTPEEDMEAVLADRFTAEGWWNREPPDPAQLLARKEARGFIEECLAGLSHNQRDAFVLKEVEGEESSQICKILTVSVTNLGVLLFRAKEKLRLCLEGKMFGKES